MGCLAERSAANWSAAADALYCRCTTLRSAVKCLQQQASAAGPHAGPPWHKPTTTSHSPTRTRPLLLQLLARLQVAERLQHARRRQRPPKSVLRWRAEWREENCGPACATAHPKPAGPAGTPHCPQAGSTACARHRATLDCELTRKASSTAFSSSCGGSSSRPARMPSSEGAAALARTAARRRAPACGCCGRSAGRAVAATTAVQGRQGGGHMQRIQAGTLSGGSGGGGCRQAATHTAARM